MITYYRSSEVETNCSPAAILEFPHLLTDKPSRIDFIAISTLLSLYLFLALAIVCDEFFVPAVERLCFKLRMPYDITGATFMAAATSAPEFFVHVIGTFITKGDIGIGTIVGSSVFNSLAITAACGICSGVTLSLDWWPITRDMIWYVIATVALTVMVIDDSIVWYESLILVVLYVFNLLNLVFDRRIQKVCRNTKKTCASCFVPTGEVADLEGSLVDDPQEGAEADVYKFTKCPKGEGCCKIFFWIVSWPAQLIFLITIPDCRRVKMRNCYWLSLAMCVIWISILSYLISWFMTVVGFNLFIPDSIMGITFLAAGTSIPEAIASIVVTRKGYGSMFVCNVLSSNTFDILICLGIPWLLKGAFFLDKDETGVRLHSSGMMYISGTLLTTAAIMYIAFMATHFTLNKCVGWVCLIVYVIYLAFACVVEMNVFGVVNLPTCLNDFH